MSTTGTSSAEQGKLVAITATVQRRTNVAGHEHAEKGHFSLLAMPFPINGIFFLKIQTCRTTSQEPLPRVWGDSLTWGDCWIKGLALSKAWLVGIKTDGNATWQKGPACVEMLFWMDSLRTSSNEDYWCANCHKHLPASRHTLPRQHLWKKHHD